MDYLTARAEEDPFLNTYMLDPINENQYSEIMSDVEDMTMFAHYGGLSEDSRPIFSKLLFDHIDMFCMYFSSRPPAVVPPLMIELTSDANSFKVLL